MDSYWGRLNRYVFQKIKLIFLGVMDIFQDKFKTIASNGHFSGSFFLKD